MIRPRAKIEIAWALRHTHWILVMKPPRTPWTVFSDVLIHATETAVKQHPDYRIAKTGDALAATRLVRDTFSLERAEDLRLLLNARQPTLVSAHAYEREGVNTIPEAFADELGSRLNLPVDGNVVQTNVVSHTGADGFSRLARPAIFEGGIVAGREYVLVDDFIGMGGTLANLRGYIESQGGRVIAATTLTGKPHSAKLSLTPDRLSELRSTHGNEIENWWHAKFGHAFDALTESEARYLVRTPDADTIRNRIAAAEQAGDCATGGADKISQ